MRVVARFRMERHDVGPRVGERGDQVIHGLNHEMHVDRGRDAVFAQGFEDQRPDAEVRHVVVVHDVEVNRIGPCGHDVVDLLAKLGEVGGKD